jgi:hypothetical protein
MLHTWNVEKNIREKTPLIHKGMIIRVEGEKIDDLTFRAHRIFLWNPRGVHPKFFNEYIRRFDNPSYEGIYNREFDTNR